VCRARAYTGTNDGVHGSGFKASGSEVVFRV
jgi:hypothetical protein